MPTPARNLPSSHSKSKKRTGCTRMRESFSLPAGRNPIKHVIYIIKENRTYDQIFGDMKEGNGDPSLTMYGRDITPNEHKLALQFGMLRQLLRQRRSLRQRA